MRTIALDFDGVLHSYTSGWKGADRIPDPPVPGMADACHRLKADGFNLIVISTRACSTYGLSAMRIWLRENGFPPMQIYADKQPAELYVDDRGLRFEGDASALLAFVKTGMEPWNKGAQAKV